MRFAMLNDEFESYDHKQQFSTDAVRNFAAHSDDDGSELMKKDARGNILPGRYVPDELAQGSALPCSPLRVLPCSLWNPFIILGVAR